MNTYPTIYSNHAYGESVYYSDDEREGLIADLAECFAESVDEFRPGFMDNENEIDLFNVYNEAGNIPTNLQDGWYDLHTIISLMMDGAREIFDAFRADMASLDEVLTITEAADEYNISREAVEKSILRGRLPARQSGATWIFRREDAARLWNHTLQS